MALDDRSGVQAIQGQYLPAYGLHIDVKSPGDLTMGHALGSPVPDGLKENTGITFHSSSRLIGSH